MGKNFEVNLVSKYRQEIYGFAAIWVMLSHVADYSVVDFSRLGRFGYVVQNAFSHGNISVDIFLFLSGISLYYAWTKKPDIDHFYRGRIGRILPSYVLIVVVVGIIQSILKIGWYPRAPIFMLSGIELFVDGGRYVPWYASAILFFYLIFPVIFVFLYGKNSKHHALRYLVLMIASYALILFVHRYNPDYYNMIEIVINRIPVFVTGVFAGAFVKAGKKYTSLTWLLLIIMTVAYVYIRMHLDAWYYRVPLIIGAIPLSYLIAAFARFLDNRKNAVAKGLQKFLQTMGSISFEFYIAHVMFCRVMNTDDNHVGIGIWTIGMIISFIVSIYVRKASIKIIEKRQQATQ